MPHATTVGLERCETYEGPTLGAAIGRAIARFGGWASLIRPGDRVLVKPNCIKAVPAEIPAQTHPAVIIEVCRQLMDAGAKPFVGDSPAWGSLEGSLNALGAMAGLKGLGVPVVPFRNPVRADNRHGRVFRRLSVDRAALEADAIVNLPKLKAHKQLLLTAAVKNMFGCVGGRRKAWWHVKAGGYDNYFGRMLVETYQLLAPTINIIDAVVAMQGNGPLSGTPYPMHMIMASRDGVALDRVAAEIVGVRPSRLRTLSAAIELDYGTPLLENIDVVGLKLEDARVTDFKMPDSLRPIGFSLPRFVKGSFTNAWTTHQQARATRVAG